MVGKEENSRKLDLFYGVIAGLGGTLGVEFFVLLDHATRLAGPAIVLSLMLSGLVNLLVMFNYAELGSSISRVGAEYTFTKAAFGGLISFLSGWLRWLSTIFTTALSAMGFAQMVQLFLPWVNQSSVAVVVIALFTMVSIKGGRKVDVITVVSFVAVFSALGIIGMIHGLHLENLEPFMPNGFYPGVLAGAMYTFSMYVGMRAIATKSPTMEEPGKVLPRSVLLSSVISTIVYCSVAFVVVGVVPRDTSTSVPLLIYAGRIVMGSLGEALVAIAWTFAALMSLATSMTVQVSVLSALSRDGYFPKIFSPSKGSRTRYIVQMIGALSAISFAATGLITFVGYASGFISLTVFALVNLSLIKLRREMPRLLRPFKTPLYPYTPIIGIIFALVLIIFVESSAIVLGLEFTLFFVIIYHLRMVGYHRLRLTFSGINLGISGITALFLCLFQTGVVQLALSPQERTMLIVFASIIVLTFFTAGILNLTESRKDRQRKG
ncbi:MAG: APC family permease [Candidatus Bathyarchaeota archaeon]|nr:APC family permease [Candidatus Bathyarchaeota archaeon]